ncbi:MAG: TatD family deoxyribonuclease [Alphaproteobacteria bacterium]|nr:TatD family deoxyribonuclease [Alphaproteobacteria bacterium]
MLVDSHCHLCSLQNLEDAVEKARISGVAYMLNAGGKFDELQENLDICNRFEGIYTVNGVHPHDAKDYADVTAQDVLKNLQNEKVVAIGECGLDYYYDFSPKDVQIKVLKEMIRAAQESSLPIVIHNRNSDDDMIEIVTSMYKQKPFKGVIHCFSSSWELAQAMLEIGFYISASGIITFNSAQDIRDSFTKIPLERLLVETDTPYLAPVPYRGKTNEPAYVVNTAEVLAQIKGVDFRKISDITTTNFFNLFDKAKRTDKQNG